MEPSAGHDVAGLLPDATEQLATAHSDAEVREGQQKKSVAEPNRDVGARTRLEGRAPPTTSRLEHHSATLGVHDREGGSRRDQESPTWIVSRELDGRGGWTQHPLVPSDQIQLSDRHALGRELVADSHSLE